MSVMMFSKPIFLRSGQGPDKMVTFRFRKENAVDEDYSLFFFLCYLQLIP